MITRTVDEKERDRYWRGRVDSRKQMLVMLRNIWKLIPGIIAGGILGAVIWMGYHAIADGTEYRAYSEFYLDFAMMENGAAYDYYNGYTWNDLMTTDKIAAHTLDNLGGKTDVAGLERITLAEILSDIRVLKVTFTDSDESLCADVQAATEKALVTFGQEAREFEQISVIKTVAPERVVADNRILQAVLLGVIIGALVTLAVMNYKYLLDDRIMIPSDLSGLDIRLLGIDTKDHDDKLESRLNAYMSAGSNPGDGAANPDPVYIDASAYQNTDTELPSVSAGTPVIISVPYRRVTRSALALLADRLTDGGCDIRGAKITDADSGFYRTYYAFDFEKKDNDCK